MSNRNNASLFIRRPTVEGDVHAKFDVFLLKCKDLLDITESLTDDVSDSKLESIFGTLTATLNTVLNGHVNLRKLLAPGGATKNGDAAHENIPGGSGNAALVGAKRDYRTKVAPSKVHSSLGRPRATLKVVSVKKKGGKKRAYPCDQCDWSFHCSSALQRHYLTHTGEKPHSCQVCGQAFGRTDKLKRHMLTHPEASDDEDGSAESAKKPKMESPVTIKPPENQLVKKQFACDQCEWSFANEQLLKRHYVRHTKEKPYVCKECGHAFTRSDTLKQHILAHKRKANGSSEKKGDSSALAVTTTAS